MGVRKRRERFTVCVSKTLLRNSFVVIIRLLPHFIMYFLRYSILNVRRIHMLLCTYLCMYTLKYLYTRNTA